MEEKKVLFKEADLLKMVGRIIEKKVFIVVVTFCFAVLGAIIAFSTAKNYTAEIVVSPEATDSSLSSSGLSSLASMVGMSVGMGEGGEAIYPLLYPDVISSIPFLTSLFDVRVQNIDGTADTTYYTYLKKYREKTWLDYAKAMPKKAVKSVIDLITNAPDIPATPVFDPYHLSKNQTKMVEALRLTISVFVDKKTNVVNLTFTDRDPRVAATMADTIMNRLKREITQYRTKKAIDDCAYIERMYLESKDSLEASQKRYADFLTHNRNIINQYVIVEKEKLMADKELKTTLYTQWAQQLMLAKAKVQEQTPVFVTLKPVTIPANASSMGRAMKTMLYAFLGAVFAVAYVLMKDTVVALWRKVMRKSEE